MAGVSTVDLMNTGSATNVCQEKPSMFGTTGLQRLRFISFIGFHGKYALLLCLWPMKQMFGSMFHCLTQALVEATFRFGSDYVAHFLQQLTDVAMSRLPRKQSLEGPVMRFQSIWRKRSEPQWNCTETGLPCSPKERS